MAKKKINKIFVGLTAGGSGGHMYPLLAVAKSIQKTAMMNHLELDLRYFGDPGNFAKDLADKQVKISRIASSKWRRYFSLQNFLDIFKFFWGIVQAMWVMYWRMPDVVFSKAGPGVVPILFVARWYNIPVVIHETDAVPGRANYLSSKHADLIEVAFAEVKDKFPEKVQHLVKIVGNPVREDVLVEESREQSRQILGVKSEKPVLLVMGGSQGAEALNYFILENSQVLLQDFEIIHQIGKENFDGYMAEFNFMTKNFRAELKANYYPFAYFDGANYAHALNACDVILSRSGGSVFEMAAHGKPAFLVPLPNSANNHQAENAYIYQSAGAGIVIEEGNLLPTLFITQLKRVLGDSDRYRKMSEAAKSFYHPNAADYIARDVLQIALKAMGVVI
ncbi:MAG: hypothetical protein COU10_02915 [Candidatus Harrisonbacteria bacterium CG10_big_fil_rev_8_21_14_0_10_45_28]|uniref:UDP-N-acetylglucosamine--N-acetylmuramyl-(pentapeptide) pyrophosphoryl-undecaprenol N-acetylglucosamine transferase n=1 Tax=Candidatus Harrisonbacteria bacterium CG10_big_fil_rev_8_21_14_0_10_45_28 TaxID=1974586 RepID=A0A2H0UMX8_9BACT|nr:MAG: hypothetical protein COU10_02915 [Candidatus Harrisonbacteria bacterium CG10_big_fil_rev_8_21_14_0_10_45_28]